MSWSKVLDYICALNDRKSSMAEVKTVHVVVKQAGAGYVVLVASNHEKAGQYIDAHPYESYIIFERTIDKAEA